MSVEWPFAKCLNLRGNGKAPIDARDAERQTVTATEILKDLTNQPGIVLADQVGMGKTYVALATLALFRHFNPSFRVLVMTAIFCCAANETVASSVGAGTRQTICRDGKCCRAFVACSTAREASPSTMKASKFVR